VTREFESYQVDAFSARPFGGNPAAVVLLDQAPSSPHGAGWPADDWMQAVAAENNLSETAFVARAADVDGRRGLRWFTPLAEVDLCGHATVASAHVLAETGRLAADPTATFMTRSGELRAAVGADGWIELDFPALPAEILDDTSQAPDGLLDALGAPAAVRGVGRSRFDTLVELASAAEVARLRPDAAALRPVPTRGVIVTAAAAHDDPDHDFVSRFFAPAVGIDEDPVTGSAHCVLTPYWAARLGRDRMRARQISARGGELRVRVLPEGRVGIAGQAVTVLRGRLTA
jgi:PhzF family phenazine biosynthesis protein